jgi:hypothetical protein
MGLWPIYFSEIVCDMTKLKLFYYTEDNVMTKYYTRFATALILAVGLSISPITNAKTLKVCGTSIAVAWWIYPICATAVGGLVAGCSAPIIDGGFVCGGSIATVALTCGVSTQSMKAVVRNCLK